MKIGLISRGRTYSTAILQSLAYNHKLKNFGEDYLTVHESTRNFLNKNSKPAIETFSENLLIFTENLFLEENFICKLWPNMIMFIDYHVVNSPTKNFEQIIEIIKNSIVFDITKYWKIKEYDALYYLDRNLYQTTLSWVYIKKIKRSHLYKNSSNTNLPIIHLTNHDMNIARRHILDCCIQQKIKEFLINNSINFIEITDNHSSHINSNITTTLESNNNYELLIENYQPIRSLITDWYAICLEKTKDWHFY